jgi:hypothetical protein
MTCPMIMVFLGMSEGQRVINDSNHHHSHRLTAAVNVCVYNGTPTASCMTKFSVMMADGRVFYFISEADIRQFLEVFLNKVTIKRGKG